ncbi:MAG TPA: efflux RND transporter periplasmic adaptor subunit, partial [Vicinamibacterales bacterium]|nr:efflux RND transporter periplasmic adaptor subunit [Vicinamibacterales bacterium]
MKTYRTAFGVALVVNLALLGALGGVWWRTRHAGGAEPTSAASAVSPSSTAPAAGSSASPRAPATPTATPLAPVQLTPQRLQQIGVTFGPVREQAISTHVRTTGNVAIDERRVSSVQLRFAGWIQQVFVNSTFQRVRQGQPLFTIYSPELVTTEREYLL